VEHFSQPRVKATLEALDIGGEYREADEMKTGGKTSRGVGLAYVVPPPGQEGVQPETKCAVLLIRPPSPPSNPDTLIINVGEAGVRVYKPTGEMFSNPSPDRVQQWADRFSKAAVQSAQQIGKIRVRALADQLSLKGNVWDDPDFSVLGRSLAEACEIALLLLMAANTIGENTAAIDQLLSNPIMIESVGQRAVETAQRISTRFRSPHS